MLLLLLYMWLKCSAWPGELMMDLAVRMTLNLKCLLLLQGTHVVLKLPVVKSYIVPCVGLINSRYFVFITSPNSVIRSS